MRKGAKKAIKRSQAAASRKAKALRVRKDRKQKVHA